MSRFLRRMITSVRPRGTRLRVARPASPKARLFLRALEDRLVPTTFTVTNTGDAGTGSGTSGDLRYCITQVNVTPGPDVIDATGVTGTITLQSVLPSIFQSVTIIGPGANLLTINANGAGPILHEVLNGNLTVSGMTLTGGHTSVPTSGAAIDFGGGGNLTVENCWIVGNVSSQAGGGIDIGAGGSLLVQGSTLSGNSCGANGSGGAIAIYGALNAKEVVIENCTIVGNTSGGFHGGGGVCIDSSNGAILIQNCTITGNTATGNVGGGIGGGGISLQSGGYPYYVPPSIASCIISGNVSTVSGADLSVPYSNPGPLLTNDAIGVQTGY